MTDAAMFTLVDGVRIAAPDSLDLITPYVLREQQDFFEDELRFVRELLQPGENVIDIGANYGVYTLPIAKIVGADGHVWAFEPTSSTAQFLAQGIAANGFGHVTLVRKAVSSAAGSGRLALNQHSELNSISHEPVSPGSSETVPLVTLDGCMQLYGWTNMEFVKIDAEGEESNIVKGGTKFFHSLSPLVQYELRKTANDMNFEVVRWFAALGYDSYRLIPGLNVLAPFDLDSQPDPYLLNLFCCNADRAGKLAARGKLIRSEDLTGTRSSADARYHWTRAIAGMQYAAPLICSWEKTATTGGGAGVANALAEYARSRDRDLPMAERFSALTASFIELKELCRTNPARLRLASLARIANDYGERACAVKALIQLLDAFRQGNVDPSEPFIAPLERFDTIEPRDELTTWLLGAILEQLEHRERFSSFYAGPSARERLEDIAALGFGSDEMHRRLDLVRRRFGSV